MNMNEALRLEIGNVMIAGKRSVPRDETILEIRDGIAVCVFDDGELRERCSPFPERCIVRRKPW
mgnify:FL=1